MLFWSPFLLGILAGIILIALSAYLKNKGFSKLVIMIPIIVLLATGIIMFYLGYVVIRGFEGFAYSQFGVANLFCLLIRFFVFINDSKKT
ncbi:hypothetical protein [Solibacillus cecembensis]|uniref:hypothetical protein n=1 Tax=Solibacillus cecembensis TaxID=459347 RepID=UPI00071738D2